MIKKEQLYMELRARIFVILAISSLILYLSVEGLNILPSISQPNSRFTPSPKDQGLRVLDLAKEASQPSLPPGSPLQEPIDPPTAPSLAPGSPLDKPIDPPTAPSFAPGSPLDEPIDPPIAPSFAPVSPLDEPIDPPTAPSFVPVSSLDEAKDAPTSSPVSDGGKEAETPVAYPNSIAVTPSPSGFFDHDVALAIESRIKQSQTDSQLAMDEAKKLLDDPNIASSETGKCLSKCVEKYGASLNKLNTAITDLGVRDVTLLADDFSAVETDIGSCQACFSENMGEDSPMKGLEEATTKAARECLTVMDYAS